MIILKIILFILLAILGIILLLLVLPVHAEFSFIDEEVKYRFKYAFLTIADSEGNGLLGTKTKKTKKRAADRPQKINADTDNNSVNDEKNEVEAEKNSSENIQEDKQVSETAADKENKSTSKSGEDKSKSDDSKSDSKTPKIPKLDKTPGEMVGLLMDIWKSANRPLRKILKGFHFYDIYIDFMVADEDAYKCAIKYGRVCTLLYNSLAHFSNIFTARIKRVSVVCGFGKEKSRWDGGIKVYFQPITAVIAGLWFLITYIFKTYLPAKIKKRKIKKSAEKQKTQPQGGM